MPKKKFSKEERNRNRTKYINEVNEGIRRSIFGKNKGSVNEALWIYREDRREQDEDRRDQESQTGIIDIENDHNFVYQAKISLLKETIGMLKTRICRDMAMIGVRKDQLEVFFPYCKMLQDDSAMLKTYGVALGNKVYYRIKPGETIRAP